MKGDRYNRPGPNGAHREMWFGERKWRHLANVRWLDENGLVHQASDTCNLTLCELDKQYPELLHFKIVEATAAHANCVGCIGYVTWPQYPVG
jgi:hypothetical protein